MSTKDTFIIPAPFHCVAVQVEETMGIKDAFDNDPNWDKTVLIPGAGLFELKHIPNQQTLILQSQSAPQGKTVFPGKEIFFSGQDLSISQ